MGSTRGPPPWIRAVYVPSSTKICTSSMRPHDRSRSFAVNYNEGHLWHALDVVSLQIDRGTGHSGSGLQILKDWDNRDCSRVRARRPLISAEEKLTARI
jgi:hypothetical protein